MCQQVQQLSESSKTLVACFFLFGLKVDFYSIGANAAGSKEVLLHDLPFVLLVKQRFEKFERFKFFQRTFFVCV